MTRLTAQSASLWMTRQQPARVLRGLLGEEAYVGAQALSIVDALQDKLALLVLESAGLNGTSRSVLDTVGHDPTLVWRGAAGLWGLQPGARSVLLAELRQNASLFERVARAAIGGLRLQVECRTAAGEAREPQVRRDRLRLVGLLAATSDPAASDEYATFMRDAAVSMSVSDVVAARTVHEQWPAALPADRSMLFFEQAIGLYHQGRTRQAMAELERALAAVVDPRLRMSILMWLGIIGRKARSADREAVRRRLVEASALAEQLDDSLASAVCLTVLGRVHTSLASHGSAIEALQKATALDRKLGNARGLAMALNALGRGYTEAGRAAEAIDPLVESVEVSRKLGNARGLAMALNALGRGYTEAGRPAEAIDPLVESVEVWRKLGNARGLAMALNALGRGYTEAGRPAEAIDPLVESVELGRRLGNQRHLAMTLLALGRARLEAGDSAGSVSPLQESVAINERLGHPKFVRIAKRFLQAANSEIRTEGGERQ